MQTVEGLASLLPFLLIAAAFWFLLIRPQRRQQQQLQRVQRELEVGDEVMLGSGVYGTVAGLLDDRVELEVAPGVRLQVARAAIVRVVSEPAILDSDPRTGDDVDGDGPGSTRP